MTIRTPRRRISPQTKRRYKAIKGFFRRALGSPSQSDLLQIASSIAVNVTDINHKIVGLERQLSEVSKQCRDINYHDDGSIPSKSHVPSEVITEVCQRDKPSRTQLKEVETNIISCPSENHSEKSDKSDRVPTTNNETKKVESINKINDFPDEQIKKSKRKANKNDKRGNYDGDLAPNYRKYKTEIKSRSKSTHESVMSAYSTSSFHSVDQYREIPHSNLGHSAKEKKSRLKVQNEQNKEKAIRVHLKKINPDSYDHHHENKAEKITKIRKPKRNSKELGQDFIADIIKRQYKPVKVFGQKHSDLSLFSVPVCRDRDVSLSTDCRVPQNFMPFACNCGERHRYPRHSDCTDGRSVSNAQFYNVQRVTRKKRSRNHADVYNDSNIYDLVPVKEKTSPKSRRKFFEDHIMPSVYYKEVPPSPRSHRPQLNLKAQYSESDFTMNIKNPSIRISPKRTIGHQATDKYEENGHPYVNRNKIVPKKNATQYITGEIEEMGKDTLKKRGLQIDTRREFGAINSLHPVFNTEENTAVIETPLNETQDTVFSDKTDKALCEIKDILQNFLLEIKKEASSHSSKSEVHTKTTDCNGPQNDVKTVPESINNGSNFNSYNSAQCAAVPTSYIPTIPTFGNTCCYPVVPVCPMNYMQNSCAVPSPSFTCNNCIEKVNDTSCSKDTAGNNTISDQSGTNELIKEIYNFVSRSPIGKNSDSTDQKSNTRNDFTDVKELTSRSAGGSTRVCKHDAKVGSTEMKYVSKNCEAVDLKISSEVYTNDTNASYTDSVSENLSLEPTGTLSTLSTEFTTELSVEEKTKKNRFIKVMQSLGLYKKTKKDVIQELSESECTIEEKVKKSPFRQDITNYAMYGQEYNRSPPIPPRNYSEYPVDYRPPYNPDVPTHHQPKYLQDYRPPYNPDIHYQDPRMQHPVSLGSPHRQYHSEKRPTAPPYCESYESYNQMQPHVPFCLKEVEVKSVGCQSERKISFFQKMRQKSQRPPGVTHDQVQRNDSTQTQTDQKKPGFFSWKSPQTKLMERQKNSLAYSLKVQKNLMERDQKMKNVMVNKLLNKRNPFSRKNLIINTLLGQEKFSNGMPSYRPKSFF